MTLHSRHTDRPRPNSHRRCCATLVLALVVVGLTTSAVKAEPPDTVRILTIGNSFAQNACRYLEPIAESAGRSIHIEKANLGGASLKRHWTHVAAWLEDPQSEAARPLTMRRDGSKSKVSLHTKLTAERWDYITIQQASFRSYKADTFEPYGSRLHAFVRKHAPQAEVLIHQTWAYRVDDKLFHSKWHDIDQEQMYQRLTECYRALAERCGGLRIIPVGAAFQHARRSDRWNLHIPEFDPESMAYPQLPDTRHSLISGWKWRKRDGTWQLRLDGHHANVNGEYLAGLIWFGFLFDEDPRKVSYRPTSEDPHGNISAEDAALLRELAWDTLIENRKLSK